MNQQTIWNKLAEQWSIFRRRTPSEVENFIADKKGKILDLGCGSGRNIIPNTHIKYYGVDFSEEMLKIAEKTTTSSGFREKQCFSGPRKSFDFRGSVIPATSQKNKKTGAIFFQVDIGKEKLPFKTSFFDAAVFISTLHCLETEKERKYALKELYRVMKKNSNAMISVWKRGVNGLYGKEGLLNWKNKGVNYARYYYFYDEKELESLLKSVGFKIIKAEKQDSSHSNKNIVVYVQKK